MDIGKNILQVTADKRSDGVDPLRGRQATDCRGQFYSGNQREHEERKAPKKDGWMEKDGM
jgi:hypothetical protein